MRIETVATELRDEYRQQGAMPVALRKKRLQELKKVISQSGNEITVSLKADLGKSSFESYTTEVGFILEEIGTILRHLESWCEIKKVKTPISLLPGKSFIHPEPYGVVLIISPWNYPFQLCMSPFIGALAAGNKVVLKPSEFAPKTSAVIAKILTQVFSPDEVRVIEGGLDETQVLLAQKFDYIFFTGSPQVGKIMMKAAAEHLTPVTLELGGKSPCLIEKSANLDIAAKRIAWGKFLNSGQSCVAPDYVLVPRQLQTLLVEKLKYYIEQFFGQDVRSSADYSRIVNSRHFDRLNDLIIDEKVVIGGHRIREENFIAPTVMTDVDLSDKIMQNEIFGPLLPLIPYDDLDQALGQILQLPKPLAFYVFSEDQQIQKDIISQIPFGGGCINDTVIHVANHNLPFGGVGTSGIGSYHGKKSFDTFTHYKSVFKQPSLVDVPLRYPPYSDKKLEWVKLFLR
jgi:aldehyde dehydrogenase (NAD+)